MSNKHQRPTVKTPTLPVSLGSLLPALDRMGQPLATEPAPFDADREPDFAGPDGPARFSKRPIQTSPIPAVAEQSAEGWGLPIPQPTREALDKLIAADQAAQARHNSADAATGQPAPATMPSGPDLAAQMKQTLLSVALDPLWHQRLCMLASRAGVDPARYVEGLIKAKWVLGPMDHPVPR